MSEEIIDRGALQRLLDVVGGDPEDLLELVEEFENTTPGLLRSMQDAAASGDQRALRIAAHSLKANGRDFGATRLADLCGALEADCRDGTAADPGGRVAADGVEALAALRNLEYDAVLLDTMMAEMDGAGVLARVKADDRMRDVPVIVISALDDETETVVKAIELGAEDFLPKDFDLVPLKARLGASLSKKRFRDQERDYFGRIERLTEAAEVLESGRLNPDSLELDEIASRDDPIGLLVGLLGVSLVLLTRFDMSNGAQTAWLLFAMLLPLLFAVEALVLAGKRPEHIGIFASVGLMMALSTLLLVPLAYARGDLLPLGPRIGRLEVLVVLMGIVGAGSLLLAFHLISTAGAVFYSQSAYAMTFAGVVWGMLLLNEELSSLAWVAFAVIVVGMYLVEPKSRDEELVIKRSCKD